MTAPEPELAIVTRGLTKAFPARRRNLFEVARRVPKRPAFTALDGVDLEIRKGELFGLLGPNGAGKTTLVKILSTLLLPSQGDAMLAGLDVRKDADAIRKRVGVVLGGDRALYWRLTARENLWYFSQLYDMPGPQAREAIDRVLTEVGLTDRADDRVENYSKGMKQRLHIARGLLTNPDILLLDEPSIGLDPHAARAMRDLVRKLVTERGHTVVLTTHYLYEADELSDRIAVLHKGRIIAQGTPDELKAQHLDGHALVVRVRNAPPDLAATLAAVSPDVRRLSANVEARHDGTEAYRLVGELGEDDVATVADLVARSGARLVSLQLEEPTLEDTFVRLTGETLSGAIAPAAGQLEAAR